ncbi:uncharacterized protein LOC135696929 isoform X2 [Ochlerotatus camptorhynchus]|uniref:uncharacterized protein LOC135696929 isoform X2 n=1 Tax=Ochlerotatus camptorhynchus TaxID=644619 RepID=UPI0031DAE4D6
MNFGRKPPALNSELVQLLDTIDSLQGRKLSHFPQRPRKNQHNKGGANQQRQQRGGNNANYHNHNNMNGHGGGGGGNDFRHGRNDDFNDVSYSSMESGSPQKTLVGQTDPYQPKFSLGCWSCTKLPSFECRCGAFYCDAECQRTDWPIHKDICLPRLVPISYSNKRIILEATASKQSSMFSNAPFSSDLQSQQQNQNNHRGQTNARKNNNNNNNQGKNLNKDSPRQQQPKADQLTPNSSPVEAPAPDNKVSRVANKLQRMKIAKSVVGGAAAAATPVAKGVLLPGVFPREGSMVKITASLPSGVAYIYHNNGKEGGQHSDYYLLTNRMFKATADAKPLTEVPSVDDVIFAPFLGGFYRAKVLSVDGEKLEVFFVDFGNSDTVPWKQSREIADGDLKWAKYLTYPVVMEGVDSFTGEMIKLLETLEHVEDFELVKAEPARGSMSVVLKRPKQSLTLNMELIELKERELRLRKEREEQKERERLEKEREKKQEQEKKQQQEQEKKLQQQQEQVRKVDKVEVKVADPSNYQPVLFDESMETKPLPMGGPKKLLIIDASDVLETRIISVVAFEEVEKYAAVLEQCNLAGGADSNVYKPTDEGEVCLVLYQEDWSRALYDISDGSFMLLDVGIIASVPAANVRRFPPGISRVVYNNEVFVANLPKLKGKMKDGKPDSVHGMPIDAKIAASEDGLSITIVDSVVAGDS